MLYVIETSKVAQFTKNATGNYASNARYTSQQQIVFLIMGLAIPPELGGYIPEFLVHETEKTHPTLQGRLGCRVFKDHIVQPLAILVAPMVVIELLRLLDPEIQQLHLDVALDPPEILHKIVPSPEKTTKFFALLIRDNNTLQTTILQFPADQLRIDPIRLRMALLPLAMDISWVHHQTSPIITLETTVGMIAAATRLVGNTYFMAREMFQYILMQLFRVSRHTKGLASEKIR